MNSAVLILFVRSLVPFERTRRINILNSKFHNELFPYRHKDRQSCLADYQEFQISVNTFIANNVKTYTAMSDTSVTHEKVFNNYDMELSKEHNFK